MTEPAYDPTDPMWVEPDVAAHVAKVQVDTIRQWKARGLVRANDRGLYSLRDIWNWLEQRDTAKVRQSASGIPVKSVSRYARAGLCPESSPPSA